MPLLQKLDRYILSEFWLPLVSGAGIITGVWLGIDKFKDVFKLLARSGASFDKGLVILGLEIPQILAVTLPISILLATFLTFQKLSGQSEILAMRAAGVSYRRLMRPVIILGVIGALASFILSEVVVPVSAPFAKQIYMVSLYKNPMPSKSRSFSYFEKNSDGKIKRIFYVENLKDDHLKNIVILDFSQQGLAQIYTAHGGAWMSDRGGWLLEDGSTRVIKNASRRDNSSLDLASNFSSTFIPSGINPSQILKNSNTLSDMNVVGLWRFINEHGKNIETSDLNPAKTKFHTRFSYPASCILLALIGASLGISGRRKVINVGYIVIGLVVFVFYMTQTIFDSFGDSGRMLPVLAAWMPNIILGLMAAMSVGYRAAK